MFERKPSPLAEMMADDTASILSQMNKMRRYIRHWPTDGGWKEVILRKFLRQLLHGSIQPLTGFVFCDDETVSQQLDILLHDSKILAPFLFDDGDLVITSPEPVRGVIEVKTTMHSISKAESEAKKLLENARLIRAAQNKKCRVPRDDEFFVGLFYYNWNQKDHPQLNKDFVTLAEKVRNLHVHSDFVNGTVVSAICVGKDHFLRFQPKYEVQRSDNPLASDAWHAYELPEQSFGYFVRNVALSMRRQHIQNHIDAWFGPNGKHDLLLQSISPRCT